jgi:hypothetical protein
MQEEEREKLIELVFAMPSENLGALYLEIFKYQYSYCEVYQAYCNLLGINEKLSEADKIPFLPISLFKTRKVSSAQPLPAKYFASSGTTGMIRSKHYIQDINIYEKSFLHNFTQTYGAIEGYSILGLLPSYLEQTESSLVYMVDCLIKKSGKYGCGFFMHNKTALNKQLIYNETNKIPTILFGVTYALLDFADEFPMPLQHCTIIETGGMKGRRKELTRKEVHQILCEQFSLPSIHSEYGMTELFAQSYSKGEGVYFENDLLQVCIRADDDPFHITYKFENKTTGLLNVIDLSNIDSCSFIATDDIAVLNSDGSFTIEGRADNSDIRGCSLLAL